MQVRFITFLITLIVFVGDCYSIIGPTLQLAAETVALRLRRPVKILLDLQALSPAAAQSKKCAEPLHESRRGTAGLKTAARDPALPVQDHRAAQDDQAPPVA